MQDYIYNNIANLIEQFNRAISKNNSEGTFIISITADVGHIEQNSSKFNAEDTLYFLDCLYVFKRPK